MGMLLTIFFGFLAWLALKATIRSARIGGKAIDGLFDRLENKIKD